MSPKYHMEEGIAARGSHHPMKETHRKCRKLNSLCDCGRRGGEDSGGFLQEGLKDAGGWAAGKERWGLVGRLLLHPCPWSVHSISSLESPSS